jgi:SOS-response transcriptional repressor LexA
MRENTNMEQNNVEPREWLRARIDRAPHGTKSKLAKFLGVSPNAITRMLNEEPGKELRRISAEEFLRMREFFNESEIAAPVDGLRGPVPISPQRVAYGGTVRAGEFLPVDEDYNQDAGDHMVPSGVSAHPAYPTIPQAAWKVSGDSMDQAGILDGMWVVAGDYSQYVDQVGELGNGNYVVVERTKNGGGERELTVKEVQFARRGMRLIPRSSNPRHKEFFIPLDSDVDNDVEIVRILAVVFWAGWDMDPRSK